MQEYGIRTVVVSNIQAEAAGVTVGDQYEWDEVCRAGLGIGLCAADHGVVLMSLSLHGPPAVPPAAWRSHVTIRCSSPCVVVSRDPCTDLNVCCRRCGRRGQTLMTRMGLSTSTPSHTSRVWQCPVSTSWSMHSCLAAGLYWIRLTVLSGCNFAIFDFRRPPGRHDASHRAQVRRGTSEFLHPAHRLVLCDMCTWCFATNVLCRSWGVLQCNSIVLSWQLLRLQGARRQLQVDAVRR
jgi:hypothetical protein